MAQGTIVKAYRGPAASLPTLEAGQLGFTTDTKILYVGDGVANHAILMGAQATAAGLALMDDANAAAQLVTLGAASAADLAAKAAGPASSTAGHMVTFAGASGKVLADGGAMPVVGEPTMDTDGTAGIVQLASWMKASAMEDDATAITPLELGAVAGSKVANSILRAKGSLLGASAASTPAEIPVGTNNQVLIADNAQAKGVKWGAVPSHAHAESDITNLATDLAAKAAGPASSTAGHLATFADASGKVLADGGAVPTGGSSAEVDAIILGVF